jgi:hypothetical protein
MRITERGLVRRATPRLLEVLRFCAHECRISHELPIGSSIADLVILRSRAARNWPDAPLTLAESVVLSALRQRGTARIDAISRDVFLSAGAVRRILAGRLADWGLVRPRDRGMVKAQASWVTASEIVAIEAKLTRWREALAQAVAYRRYADRAFVLLPQASAMTAILHKDAFRSAGVGLISYDSSELQCLIGCRRTRLHTWHREYALSRL